MIAVGRKGRDFFKRRNVKFVDEYIGLTGSGQVVHSDAVAIADKLIKTFTEDETIDKVFIVFTEFKTVLSQKPVIEQLLPIPKTAQVRATNAAARRLNIFTNSRPLKYSENCCRNRSKRRSIRACWNRSRPSRDRE